MKTLFAKDILLPKNQNMEKWGVVSCDQFTSQPKYWEKLKEFVGNDKSTLDLIFPEVYLGEKDSDLRIKNINAKMQEYLDEDIFETIKNSFILVERDTFTGVKRYGLIGAVDLEHFDFTPNAKSIIRPTEGVVEGRIPPRLKIRVNALLELPHIMLLIDDPDQKIIEKLADNKGNYEKLYDFDLNMKGGHIKGYRIPEDDLDLSVLYDKNEQIKKYGEPTNFIFAVGDGNHSLATAKVHWENLKKTLSKEEIENHPARYALCEINNIHSNGIVFEPIHRIVFGVDDDFIEHLKKNLSGNKNVCVFYGGEYYYLPVDDLSPLAIKQIQQAIDSYGKGECDYIHGDNHLLSIAKESGGVAIFMPNIEKQDLFKYVLHNGVLSRKSFSMGEAEEKRYYVEARKIK